MERVIVGIDERFVRAIFDGDTRGCLFVLHLRRQRVLQARVSISLLSLYGVRRSISRLTVDGPIFRGLCPCPSKTVPSPDRLNSG